MPDPFDLVMIAFFTGVGVGIGNPIGQAIYRRFFEKHGKNLAEIIDKVGEEYGLKPKKK